MESGSSVPSRPGLGWRLAVLAAGGAAVAVALWCLPVKRSLVEFVEWVGGFGPLGPVMLGAVWIPVCLFMFPGSILSLGAGFAFGVVGGTISVSIGSTLGASAAFWMGRTLARGWVESRVAGNVRFAALDRAVGTQGFKIVLLTRLSPVFPFNLQNYFYGVTRVSFRDYVLASWIGMFPGTLMYVYFGKTLGNLAEALSGGFKVEGGVWGKVLFWGGLALTVVGTAFVTRIARRALREAAPGTG